MNVRDPDANEFIVSGLNPGTPYVCSMLAYTAADGPRTLYLTASTYSNGKLFNFTIKNWKYFCYFYTTDYTPFIIQFGINGDGLDKATMKLTSEGGITVHCDTGISNVTINWVFSNGSLIGSTDRNIRQAKYRNGTTILQIARGRSLDYCDAGVYTCRAVGSSGLVQERQFTLRVNS